MITLGRLDQGSTNMSIVVDNPKTPNLNQIVSSTPKDSLPPTEPNVDNNTTRIIPQVRSMSMYEYIHAALLGAGHTTQSML